MADDAFIRVRNLQDVAVELTFGANSYTLAAPTYMCSWTDAYDTPCLITSLRNDFGIGRHMSVTLWIDGKTITFRAGDQYGDLTINETNDIAILAFGGEVLNGYKVEYFDGDYQLYKYGGITFGVSPYDEIDWSSSATADYNAPHGTIVGGAADTITSMSVPITKLDTMPACGDPDGDGVISTEDAYILSSYVDGYLDGLTANQTSLDVMDIDGSGIINANDVVYLTNYINDPIGYPLKCSGVGAEFTLIAFSVDCAPDSCNSCNPPCDTSVHIEWQNTGDVSGTLAAGYTYKGVLHVVDTVTLLPGETHVVNTTIEDQPSGTHEICASPPH